MTIQSTDELVKRLREPEKDYIDLMTVTSLSTGERIETFDPLKREAADTIESLSARLAAAEKERDGLLAFKQSVDEALNSGDGSYRP